MSAERAEVVAIRGEIDARQRQTIEQLLAAVNFACGVGRNEPRKEGEARKLQELADAPMNAPRGNK